VLVHGNGGGGFRFERMRAHAPAGVRLFAPTLPGFAGADTAMPRTMAGFAQALAGELERAPRPRVALGHGIGGSIVLEMLRERAGAADAVILHAPVGARLDRRWFPRLMRPRLMRELGRRAMAAGWLRPLWKRLLFREPVPEEYLRRFFAGYGACAAFGLMFDLITPEWFASLRPAAARAALLWGARERVLRAGQAEEFRRLLPGARVEIVPDWDHFPMIERPREYTETVARLARETLAA
jgi:pimeloyl-ACP methyl ester carboxylesterase